MSENVALLTLLVIAAVSLRLLWWFMSRQKEKRNGQQPCPLCAEDIKCIDTGCRHCGSVVPAEPFPAPVVQQAMYEATTVSPWVDAVVRSRTGFVLLLFPPTALVLWIADVVIRPSVAVVMRYLNGSSRRRISEEERKKGRAVRSESS
ncbi:hypothetical protein LuPra_05109 [Luteitalea pratensis]|uniref:Uncharacterized protein n=1 Tax=Luteitalea pratensis TaxID=1855912 RepID=A0A143PVI5_LUTPR|nr:hypothetical protein LuPra_05109 [Luteitalea pratensis]